MCFWCFAFQSPALTPQEGFLLDAEFVFIWYRVNVLQDDFDDIEQVDGETSSLISMVFEAIKNTLQSAWEFKSKTIYFKRLATKLQPNYGKVVNKIPPIAAVKKISSLKGKGLDMLMAHLKCNKALARNPQTKNHGN